MIKYVTSSLVFIRNAIIFAISFAPAWCFLGPSAPTLAAEEIRVWERIEITLTAANRYDNPYTQVEVWVDLQGPGFKKRCYGFWDGGDKFRVRVLAPTPGTWTWKSGAHPDDPGLDGKTGEFTARPWSRAELIVNPNRHGMIRPTPNGHAFQYADGTPYFLLGDTWWSTPTFRYRWYDDDALRSLGPKAGFKDYVRIRKRQGYNCIAMIAAFPNWANDGQPSTLKTDDGTVLRNAWQHPGTKSAKDKHDEDGNRAFLFPGKVPGYETIFPDLQRINPSYFQNMDQKIGYLNACGFVPFIEVARRDIGQAWKKYYPWPDSYSRYIQYIWARYQANICLFSPIHFDWEGNSIPAADWNEAANRVIDTYGPPPFGTLCGTNSNPSTLHNFGHVDKARWLTFHQIGNRRTHDQYAYLTEIFNTRPCVPGIHGEPYYAGMPDAPGGSELSALYCRSGMYGSVLSGGLAGHIYGAGSWDGGMWGANVEKESKTFMWEIMEWESGDQMRHLKTFILSEGLRYRQLVPHTELLTPNKLGKPKGYIGWAYCARTDDKNLFMLYFEKDCPRAALAGTRPGGKYRLQWFDPRRGQWLDDKDADLTADPAGNITLPDFPDNPEKSTTDWAAKLTTL